MDLLPSNVMDVSRRSPESMIGVIFFSSRNGSFSSLKNVQGIRNLAAEANKVEDAKMRRGMQTPIV